MIHQQPKELDRGRFELPCCKVTLVDPVFPVRCNCSEGLGTAIARTLSSIGIKKCGGCGKRESFLNRVFPYRSKDR